MEDQDPKAIPMDALRAVNQLGSGHLIDDMHDALQEVISQVLRIGGPGTVTVTLKIERAKEIQNMVLVTEEVKTAPPKSKPHGAFYFTGRDGRLYDRDPRQTAMEIRVVEDHQEIRRVESTPDVRESNG